MRPKNEFQRMKKEDLVVRLQVAKELLLERRAAILKEESGDEALKMFRAGEKAGITTGIIYISREWEKLLHEKS